MRWVLAAAATVCLWCSAVGQGADAQQAAKSSPRAEPVKVGEAAPDFTLEDFRVENDEWKKVTLSSARGQTPVVLVFYRGHW